MFSLLGKIHAVGGTLILAVLAVLALVGTIGAQGGEGSGECTFLASVQDNGCGDSNCPSSSNFTPPCDDYYCFKCEAWCNGMPDNTIYHITAYVYQVGGGGPIASCKNWDEEGCGGNPDANCTVQLSANHSYYITVCLEACYGHDCHDCSSAGYAIAKIYHL